MIARLIRSKWFTASCEPKKKKMRKGAVSGTSWDQLTEYTCTK